MGANVVGYLQEDCSANHIPHPPENSDLKDDAASLPPLQLQAHTSIAEGVRC